MGCISSLLAVACVFGTVFARSPIDGRLRQNATDTGIIRGVYMVELHDGVTSSQLTEALGSINVTARIRHTLSSSIFHGVSLDVLHAEHATPSGTTAAILTATGVKQVWPVRAVSMPSKDVESFVSLGSDASLAQTTRRAVGDPYPPHVMAQVDRLHKAGFTGRGMRIAVVDTGVDYTNAILGGCLGPDCIVTHGWDSVGWDELLGPEGTRVPAPDDDPMDCFGHGTHVAGIISARPNAFGFIGVAPDARLGAYRAVDCLGYGTEETIAAGMLRAFDDGNDILTLSISVPGGIPDSFVSLTASRIVAAGVPVFVAIGNTGELGTMFDPVAPADGRLVSSISSFDALQEPHVYAVGEYSVGHGKPEEFGWVPLLNGRYEFANGTDQATLPLIDLNSFVSNGTPVTGCQKIPDGVPSLAGYLVLVERTPQNGCLFRSQRENIKAKGGSHLIFWGDETVIRGVVNDDLKTFMTTTTPSPAKQWRDALAAGSNISVTLTAPLKSKPKVIWTTNEKTGGQLSNFTSWGPTFDLRSTPTFGGPGGSIMSTYLQNGQGVATMGGTSMAAPFVAASAALLRQARGTLDPTTLQAILASTAKQPHGLHPPSQAGAGLIQLWDAVQAKGVLSVPNISFNDSDHHRDEVSLTLRNTGGSDAVYKLGHTATATIYAMGEDHRLARAPRAMVDAPAAITFAADQVPIAAGAEAEITVRCTPPQIVDRSRWPIYGGYITLDGTNGDNLSIPYIGNAGSMSEADVLDRRSVFVSPRFSAGDFTLPRPGDAPSSNPSAALTVTVTPLLPTRVLRYDIIAPSTNGTRYANETEWLGRRTYGQILGSPQVVFAKDASSSIKFSGFLGGGKHVQEGRYAILISALRLFAEPDSKNPDDWQAVETGPFTLRYT